MTCVPGRQYPIASRASRCLPSWFAVLIVAAGTIVDTAAAQDAAAGATPAGPRLEKTINRGWTFMYVPAADADRGREAVNFDDAAWPEIALPHTWSTYETTGEMHPYIRNPAESDDPTWWRGWGWYRKRFTIDRALAGRKVFAEFDGVQKTCRVWLNGRELGEHRGGYNSFSFDLTDAVRFGEENVLAVAVNNLRDDPHRIPPMSAGNFNVYGGIYRDVRVVVKDRLHIPYQGSSRHEGGTFVTTPKVSAEEGVVRVRTWVRNDHAEATEAVLATTLADPEGRAIETMTAGKRIEPGAVAEFDQTSRPIPKPRLWSVETPSLYGVRSEVRAGGRAVDAVQSPLGFRWFSWDKGAQRLILNGRPIHLHGTNRHQEYPWVGDAMPAWMHRMDMDDIRYGLAHNFMRTAHYTQDPRIYDYCDRHGILVCEEAPNIKNKNFASDVQEQQVREMIRRDRNHPCIVMWSMGNGVMWLYEDHGADREYRNCPLKHVNPKGWVDSYRAPKYLYYLWQANYLDKPMVFIHPHFWRPAYVGQSKEIRVDSNCERVELKVDGAVVGTLQPNDENLHSVVFKDVPVRRGNIEAVGHKGGQTVRAELPMAGEPARVTLSASHGKIEAALDSLAIIKADIVDAKGVHVYGATHTITWAVEGPARLVGPPVYQSDIHADGAMEGTMYIDAPVCNVIRAAGAPGTITVRASADGLAAGTVAIEAVAPAPDKAPWLAEPPLSKAGRKPVPRKSAQ
jgi:hypothetical protein